MIDLTGIAVSIVSGIFSILGIVVSAWIISHMKDQAAAVTVSNAVKNSLGAMQQASVSEIQQIHPQIAGVPTSLAPGVQYVLDNAGDEASRLGLTPTVIASKVEAQIGLKNIDTNIAISGNETPAIVPPLATTPAAIPAA